MKTITTLFFATFLQLVIKELINYYSNQEENNGGYRAIFDDRMEESINY